MAEHWLGTHDLGRDLFSHILFAARTAVVVGVTATAIILAIGIALGSFAGYLGGRVADNLCQLILRNQPNRMLRDKSRNPHTEGGAPFV